VKTLDAKRVGKNIKRERKKRGWTAKDLGGKVLLSESAIYMYEGARRKPDIDILFKIAKVFDMKFSELVGENVHNDDVDLASEKDDLVKIPILGTVKAGYDLLAHENIIGYSYASKSELGSSEYFYLRVSGDSMINMDIKEGYEILVRRQNYVEEGKVAVVLVNGDEATLKRVFYQDDKVVLQAENSKIPPRVYDPDEIRILGLVIEFKGKVD
jgi:repressor LexA